MTPEHSPFAPEKLIVVLGNAMRWRLLRLVADGEPWRVKDIARRLKISEPSASRYALTLYKAGMIERIYGSLYRVPERFRPAPGELDFGHVHLRFAPEQSPDAGAETA
jgi:hypothetical protein